MRPLTADSDRFDVEVMYWYHAKDLSIRQVASRLGCSEQKVAKVLHTYKPGVRANQKAMELRSSDEYREKLRLTQIGDRNHQAKLTESDVLEIRAEYKKLLGTFTKTQAQYLLANEYGVKRPTISDIVLRRTWKHI